MIVDRPVQEEARKTEHEQPPEEMDITLFILMIMIIYHETLVQLPQNLSPPQSLPHPA